jgi:hypothetical protein
VIVCFVDIDGIDDHYCLNFLFCVQWVKMRGDCLFCCYWWNWWPLLFKLSFFVFSELRWEVIVCFVDIGWIDDHSVYLLEQTFMWCNWPLYVRNYLYLLEQKFTWCNWPLYVRTYLYLLEQKLSDVIDLYMSELTFIH